MTDFLDFEAVKYSNVNEIDDTEENLVENVSAVDFIDDENEINRGFTITNVSKSVEDAMQDYFIDFDYHKKQIIIVQKIMI